jgi:chemotaxis protein methyltransferase CheR
MRVTGIDSYSSYLRLLFNTPEEYDKLFEVLCINVSEFFRDPEVWVKIRSLFDEILRAKTRAQDKNFKIWSAGCANGEEPHTIAIVMKELLPAEISNVAVDIQATDVDKKSLGLATKGVYTKDALKNVDKKLLARYFESQGSDFCVKPEVRKLLALRYLDLTSNDLVADCDIVFCRNVFIYFDRSLQEQLLMKFYKALKPGGYLVMGKSETLIREAKEIFEEVDFDSRLYRKKETSPTS